jgi:hypothetical protein
MSKIKTFVVPERGIGKRDYSEAIEFASQASFRGHQRRMVWTFEYYGIPTAPFPNFYGIGLQFFDAGGGVVIPAPDIPYHIYKVTVTTGRAALVLAGFCRFASLADANIWNVEKWYGDTYGYGKAELIYTNGIKTEQTKVYAVALSEYSERPDFDIRLSVDALWEEIVYG